MTPLRKTGGVVKETRQHTRVDHTHEHNEYGSPEKGHALSDELGCLNSGVKHFDGKVSTTVKHFAGKVSQNVKHFDGKVSTKVKHFDGGIPKRS